MIRTSQMVILPEWVDHNGHLNMAYYNVLFDKSVDDAYVGLGLDPTADNASNSSAFTAEIHVCYLNELFRTDNVAVTFELLSYDTKRLHFFQKMYRQSDLKLCATSEQLALHVELSTRKVKPFPEHIFENISTMLKSENSDLSEISFSRSIKISSPVATRISVV